MNGIVLVNKPAGLSSFKTVEIIQKLSGCARAGHAGTLDLEAEGLLIVLLNEARKLFELFMGAAKTYQAAVRLGWRSTTWDSAGELEKIKDIQENDIHKEILEGALKQFKGEYIHKVPEFSAKKHFGKTFYNIKRSGQTPPERTQKTDIFDIQLTQINLPDIKFEVTCSSGTYIRTLAVDIAKKLGTDGYLKKLVRTRIDTFALEQSVSPDFSNWQESFIDINEAMLKFPHVIIGGKAAAGIPYGICFKSNDIVKISGKITDSKFGVYSNENKFLAIAQIIDNNYKLRRVINIGYN